MARRLVDRLADVRLHRFGFGLEPDSLSLGPDQPALRICRRNRVAVIRCML